MLSHPFSIGAARTQFCKNLLIVAGIFAGLLHNRQAAAFNWSITSTADNNVLGTLRFAINNFAANDTITFAASLAGQTITLTGGELVIAKNLSITGLGATNLAIVDDSGRVFHVENGPVNVSISGLRLTGRLIGAAGAGGNFGAPNGLPGVSVTGGCIQNDSQCTLSVSDCYFVNCIAIGGAGGNGYMNDNYGFLSNGGNGGDACGGAICNNMGDLLLYRCTFARNEASAGSGGNGYYSGAGGMGGKAQGGALCDVYGNQDISIVNCTF
ncbi:MAG TPA: hypothetical protein VFC07_14815, partial [Verrucomicrobiae bacterium]|nr:hypothetical protein [Verrucomicrobiae bacterium]